MSIKRFDGNTHVRDSDGTLLIGFMVRRSFRQSNVSVTDSATKIPTTPLSNRLVLNICNNSTQIVYIGDSTVSTTNGFPIFPHAVIGINIEDNIDIYGIVASGTADVRIIEGA